MECTPYITHFSHILEVFGSFCATPFQYHPRIERCGYRSRNYQRYAWFYVGVYLLGVLDIYCAHRLIKAYLFPSPDFSLSKIIIYAFYWVVLTMSFLFNFAFHLIGTEMINVVNQCIQYDRNQTAIYNKYILQKDAPTNQDNKKVESYVLAIKLLLPVAAITSVGVACISHINDIDPARRFVLDHFPEEFHDSAVYRFATTFIILVFSVYVWAPLIVALVIPIVIASRVSLFTEFITPTTDKNYFKLHDENITEIRKFFMRHPYLAIRNYKAVVYLMRRINIITAPITPFILLFGWILHVSCAYSTIALHEEMEMPGYCIMPAATGIAFFVEVVVLPAMHKNHYDSMVFKASWLKYTHDKLVRRMLLGCPPLDFKAGNFFVFRKSTVVKFMQGVIDTTIDMVLSF